MRDLIASDVQIQTQKLKKRDLETSIKQNTCVAPKLPNNYQNAVPKSTPKSTEIPAWTARSHLLSSQVPLDRSRIPQGAKADATSMPKDTFGEPKLTTPAP